MAKDMSGFMKSFAGNMGTQLSGMNAIGNPLSGIGLLKGLFGGKGNENAAEDNPGQQMFDGVGPEGVQQAPTNAPAHKGGNSFLSKFGSSLSDQLFQKAMMGFMGR